MRDPRIPMKNPLVAGVLAFLIPGAGHWYQGRRFKATIFSGCILTMFVWGLILGHGQPVYSQLVLRGREESAQFEKVTPQLKFSIGYSVQFLVGLPAVPSLIQEARFRSEDAQINFLSEELESEFSGVLYSGDDGGSKAEELISGQLSIRPVNDQGSRVVNGTLTYEKKDGSTGELQIGGGITIGRKVFGSPQCDIECSIVQPDGSFTGQHIRGSVDRSFMNWFQAPRDSHELDRLHGNLNRRFDIASVFTWIAGLLNLLAIWDAAEGPAYGYGDEKPEDDDDEDDKPKDSPEKSTSQSK